MRFVETPFIIRKRTLFCRTCTYWFISAMLRWELFVFCFKQFLFISVILMLNHQEIQPPKLRKNIIKNAHITGTRMNIHKSLIKLYIVCLGYNIQGLNDSWSLTLYKSSTVFNNCEKPLIFPPENVIVRYIYRSKIWE